MLFWIIQTTLISILFIFLVHHLIDFLKSTLTVPKVKDLVNNNSQKYENMYNIINGGSTAHAEGTNIEYTLDELLPKTNEEITMKSELKNFLKSQLEN